ncbi:pyridoxal phosphate-dependent aminotransferase [Tahibacter amnicola]|uniref:Pyridoxal phosphate-dependent aminotransferase n=1 Tax=Tahibacter amnicola TaxID=2976241 RepID=A0ABY6BJ09_9GAMM|nr:pyridoxal phosphate-dependent aminotransferase [Tahibacter amnicola]UXI69994.1 pyridoxal phosphate-dependent aminotransferase [Tahibacter amnicola]
MQIETKLPKVGTTIFTVMSQLAVQHNAVNLGQGFPDFDGPQSLRDALAEAMNSGRNQYAPMTGIPKLREQIAQKTERLYGRKVNADTDITVTSGATEAIFAAVAAVVRPGDEVIVLDPCYDCYEPAIDLVGGRAVHVPLSLPDFSVDWQRVKDAITPRTRMIMVNSPHNPSGAVFSAQDLDTLAALTRDTEILVLSDEVYEHIIFDGLPHQSVLRHAELADRSFVVSSFGKTYHCTGWKVGYCVAPRTLSAEFRKVHQYLTFCTFSPAQWAFAHVLEHDPQHYLDLPAFYQEKRDHFRDLLQGSRFQLLPVRGAYFQLVDYSAISDKDDLNFCEWLVREAGVAAIPVSAFYETAPAAKIIRFCFAKNDKTLADAAERLRAL